MIYSRQAGSGPLATASSQTHLVVIRQRGRERELYKEGPGPQSRQSAVYVVHNPNKIK